MKKESVAGGGTFRNLNDLKIFIFVKKSKIIMKIAKELFLLVSLAEIAWADWRKRLISNANLGKLVCARGVFLVLTAWFCSEELQKELFQIFSGTCCLGLFFVCFYYMSKKKIGAGDVKLMTILGMFLGAEQAFYVAFFSAGYALVGEVIGMKNKKMNFRKEIPFAPYVYWGTVTILIFRL